MGRQDRDDGWDRYRNGSSGPAPGLPPTLGYPSASGSSHRYPPPSYPPPPYPPPSYPPPSYPPHPRPRRGGIARRVGLTVAGLFALFVVLAIIGAIVGPSPTPTSSSGALPVSTTTTTAPTPTPPTPQVVTGVVDGDTFVVAAGTVRVLGVDSCPTTTAAGPAATAAATQLLLSGPVTLTTEPGVDRDPLGRLLRYVRLADGEDFAAAMVAGPHTGAGAGTDGVSAGYLAGLRAADPDGRTCDPPPPAPVTTTTVAPDTPVDTPDPDTYVDTPDPDTDVPDVPDAPSPKRRTGHSGHPCLPGERDGDGDGYCGEGK